LINKFFRTFFSKFRSEFNYNYLGSTILLKQWGLPSQLIEGIDGLSDPSAAPTTSQALARVLADTEQCCSLYTCTPSSERLELVRTLLHGSYKLDGGQIEALLSRIPADLKDMAESMSTKVEAQASYEDLMSRANKVLVEMNLGYEEVLAKLQRTLEEKEQLNRQLQEANERLSRLAFSDPLTGVANRRRFEDYFHSILEYEGKDLALITLDLDYFKSINDRYSHAAGDVVLQHAAATLSRLTRGQDLVARLGGEEFAVLCVDVDPSSAQMIAERFRAVLVAAPVKWEQHSICVSGSFGLLYIPTSSFPAPDERKRFMRHCLHLADLALYEAKSGGRNRVAIAQSLKPAA